MKKTLEIYFKLDNFKMQFSKDDFTGENNICFLKNERFWGNIKNVNANWGNYWFLFVKEEAKHNDTHGEAIADRIFLDSCAFHNDYDGYSDIYKDMWGTRPHYSIEEWKEIVEDSKNRKP